MEKSLDVQTTLVNLRTKYVEYINKAFELGEIIRQAEIDPEIITNYDLVNKVINY